MIMGGLSFGASNQDGVRRSAVAGIFYEKDPDRLRAEITRYLSGCKPLPEPVRLLVSPHAGFVFSGPVAARGFSAMDRGVRRVFIIGPSHHRAFRGFALPHFRYYRTPLGDVEIDRGVVEKLGSDSQAVVARGFDEQEHSLEVQLPFLQVRLGDFRIVPIITGELDPAQMARALLPFIDKTTAVIASSDLSHYETQPTARRIDDASISTILSGNVSGPIDACGETAIRVVMNIAKSMDLRPLRLDARTSFETAPQLCSADRVVGYASIVFVQEKGALSHGNGSEERDTPGELSGQMKSTLLKLARRSLEASVRGVQFSMPKDVPDALMEKRGCFVTLTINGSLRGCIGYIEPIKPLCQAVVENAKSAALSDPRFSEVTVGELSEILIEVSVLTRPRPLEYRDADDLLSRLVPGRDGVILRKGPRQSTYLPQVWDQLADKRAFLEQLSLKAGMPRDGWKTAEVKTYQAVHFSE